MHKATIWLTFLLNACASAPAYREPEVEIPTAFRERLDTLAPPAQPSPNAVPVATTDTAVVGEYWRALGDTTLVRLLEEALEAYAAELLRRVGSDPTNLSESKR